MCACSIYHEDNEVPSMQAQNNVMKKKSNFYQEVQIIVWKGQLFNFQPNKETSKYSPKSPLQRTTGRSGSKPDGPAGPLGLRHITGRTVRFTTGPSDRSSQVCLI